MLLRVFRKVYTDKSTIGDLYIDGERFCYTLEDRVRKDGEKVAGSTAIPAGNYLVILDYSSRFQRDMPHICNVPGFEGIRIHNGSTDKDTRGCILVGYSKGNDEIWDSRIAFKALYERLKAHPGDITIDIG